MAKKTKIKEQMEQIEKIDLSSMFKPHVAAPIIVADKTNLSTINKKKEKERISSISIDLKNEITINAKVARAFLTLSMEINEKKELLEQLEEIIKNEMIKHAAHTAHLDNINKVKYKKAGSKESLNKTKVELFIAKHGGNIDDFYEDTPVEASFNFPRKIKNPRYE
jgi:hypothetical protein